MGLKLVFLYTLKTGRLEFEDWILERSAKKLRNPDQYSWIILLKQNNPHKNRDPEIKYKDPNPDLAFAKKIELCLIPNFLITIFPNSLNS